MKWRSLEESAQQSDRRSLHEIYAGRKELIAKYVPAEIQGAHACVIDELKRSGMTDRALKPGGPAPEFALTDHNGQLLRSAELLERGSLVICFFRGRWCPFCVGQMQAMNAIAAPLQEFGTSLVGISPQTVNQSFLMAEQHKLHFPLLSDAGNQVTKQFGLVYRVPEYQREIYSRAFVNLPFINGDSSWELPIPATYIIGTQKNDDHRENQESKAKEPRRKVILFASANPDYTNRPEPADILHTVSQVWS